MATITVRNLDDELVTALKERAAANGRSMEAEARALLARGVRTPVVDVVHGGLGTRIHAMFRDLDLPEEGLPIPPRTDPPRAASFE